MKLILMTDVEKLGDAGQVVKVKPGYGRNYLLPKGYAQLATESRVKQLDHQRRVIEEKVRKEVSEHEALRKRIDGTQLSFEVQAGEEGKLFGSVTSADIHKRLAELSFEVDRRKIQLPQPIKQLGDYEIPVRLHREVVAQIQVSVVSDGSEPPPPVVEVEESAYADLGPGADDDDERPSEA